MKRVEKLFVRKEINEVEDIYNTNNPRALRDRIAKTINQTILK